MKKPKYIFDMNMEAEKLKASDSFQGQLLEGLFVLVHEDTKHIFLDQPSINSNNGVISFNSNNPWINYGLKMPDGSLNVTLSGDNDGIYHFQPTPFKMESGPVRKLFRLQPKISERKNTEPVVGSLVDVNFEYHYDLAKKIHEQLMNGNELSKYPIERNELEKLLIQINS